MQHYDLTNKSLQNYARHTTAAEINNAWKTLHLFSFQQNSGKYPKRLLHFERGSPVYVSVDFNAISAVSYLNDISVKYLKDTETF